MRWGQTFGSELFRLSLGRRLGLALAPDSDLRSAIFNNFFAGALKCPIDRSRSIDVVQRLVHLTIRWDGLGVHVSCQSVGYISHRHIHIPRLIDRTHQQGSCSSGIHAVGEWIDGTRTICPNGTGGTRIKMPLEGTAYAWTSSLVAPADQPTKETCRRSWCPNRRLGSEWSIGNNVGLDVEGCRLSARRELHRFSAQGGPSVWTREPRYSHTQAPRLPCAGSQFLGH